MLLQNLIDKIKVVFQRGAFLLAKMKEGWLTNAQAVLMTTGGILLGDAARLSRDKIWVFHIDNQYDRI